MILTYLTLAFALVATGLPLMKLEYPALSGVVCASGANERWSVKILVPILTVAALAVLMLGVIIFCDVYYTGLITAAVTRTENPIKIDSSTIYIAKANNMLWDHIVIEIIGAAMFLLVPVYSKLLRKINTSVTVEDYGKMGAIDISGED